MLTQAEKNKRAKAEKKRILNVQLKKAEKTKRREKIFNRVKEGKLTLSEIGLKFGVTKQRIGQICAMNDFSRWTEIRETNKMLFEKVMIDFKTGSSIDEITTKYNITHQFLNYLHHNHSNDKESIGSQYRTKRDAKITKDYSLGNTAMSIVLDKNKILDDTSKIVTVNGIYRIAGRNGIKRYPQIGNRSEGGSFEKKSILKMIVKMYEDKKSPSSFHEIAGTLNELGYETVCGKEFTQFTVRVKYHAYKKESQK